MKRLLCVCVALVAFAGCADLLDPAAAVVNGEKIPVDEVTEGLERFTATQEYERLSAQGDEQAIKRQYEQGYLSQLIRRAVLEPRAEEFDVEVTDDEVQSRIDEIKNDFPSEAAFAEALKEQGLDVSQLEQLVEDSLLEEELRAEVTAEAAPSEDELRDYYASHEDEFRQTHAQHILVDDRNLAGTIQAEVSGLPKGQQQKRFEQLAKKHSTDDSNSGNGGDLGFSSPGDFVPSFEAALAELEPGDVSEPVKTQFGWHVIRLIERRVLPFSEASPQIAEQIAAENEQRVWSDWVSAAYDDAEVKVNPRYGELDVASGQVVDASAEDIPGAEVPSPEATPEVPAGG